MASEERSVVWIVVAVAALVVGIGWGILASSYAGAHAKSILEMTPEEIEELDTRGVSRARKSAMAAFIGNSLEQLPNLPKVISWHFSNRIWLPLLIGVALVLVVVGGFALKVIERRLDQPKRRRLR